MLLASDGIILTLVGNTLLLISFSYYVYITFLGYDSKFLFYWSGGGLLIRMSNASSQFITQNPRMYRVPSRSEWFQNNISTWSYLQSDQLAILVVYKFKKSSWLQSSPYSYWCFSHSPRGSIDSNIAGQELAGSFLNLLLQSSMERMFRKVPFSITWTFDVKPNKSCPLID